MGLYELTLRNFRLFHEREIQLDPEGITVFVSPNGTGKTSILEAVQLLATAMSFRTTSASDVITLGTDLAEIHGVWCADQRRIQIDMTISRTQRGATKSMMVNGQRPKSRADLVRVVSLTTFTPEGVEVVRGVPEVRRHFLTTLIEDTNASHAEIHERYLRTLSQRNALLKSCEGRRPTGSLLIELDTWTTALIDLGAEIVAQREVALRNLEPLVSDKYQQISQSQNSITLTYLPSWGSEPHEVIQGHFDEDVRRGLTTTGPHRDDINIKIDEREARKMASQGEQRSVALALRLAGHDYVRDVRDDEPLLLLDDVFSELDSGRSNRLLGLLPHGQTLVTTATPLPNGLSPSLTIDLSANI